MLRSNTHRKIILLDRNFKVDFFATKARKTPNITKVGQFKQLRV